MKHNSHCNYCGFHRDAHYRGRGKCLHDSMCDRYRVTGKSYRQMQEDGAKQRCQDQGHRWHNLIENGLRSCWRCGYEERQM